MFYPDFRRAEDQQAPRCSLRKELSLLGLVRRANMLRRAQHTKELDNGVRFERMRDLCPRIFGETCVPFTFFELGWTCSRDLSALRRSLRGTAKAMR